MSRLFRKKDDVPKRSLWQRVKDVVRTDIGVLLRGGVDQGSLEALETLLIESDFGVTTSLASWPMSNVRQARRREDGSRVP
jgi:fused signal recognition particle receptor